MPEAGVLGLAGHSLPVWWLQPAWLPVVAGIGSNTGNDLSISMNDSLVKHRLIGREFGLTKIKREGYPLAAVLGGVPQAIL